jgi:S-adenosylmethionine:tRNA ribosyltransferase-isomerase
VSPAGNGLWGPEASAVLKVSDLDYHLPEDRVATSPAEPRDAARLLVLRRSDPSVMLHRRVRDLPEFLGPGDVLVVNNTKVIPARLVGQREDTGGKVEGLFLGKEGESDQREPAWAGRHEGERAGGTGGGTDGGAAAGAGERWRVMLKGRRMKPGVIVTLNDRAGARSGVWLRLTGRGEDEGEDGAWLVEVHGAAEGESSLEVLERLGTPPLPPYIRAARKRHEAELAGQPLEQTDSARYQTVYAKDEAAGSVAAPTAGLHFTPELLERLAARGVRRAEVTLHVGAGTFKSVETEYVEQHRMHAEWCRVSAEVGQLVTSTRQDGAGTPRGRVIAVGTTAARTLESFGPERLAQGAEGWTNLLITPGFAWKNLDGMMTNFHLPRTTLMAMIAALLDERSGGAGDGVSRLKAAYDEAIGAGYRFFSYGDAMLILP